MIELVRVHNPVDHDRTARLSVGPATVRCIVSRTLVQWTFGVGTRHVWNMTWWRS